MVIKTAMGFCHRKFQKKRKGMHFDSDGLHFVISLSDSLVSVPLALGWFHNDGQVFLRCFCLLEDKGICVSTLGRPCLLGGAGECHGLLVSAPSCLSSQSPCSSALPWPRGGGGAVWAPLPRQEGHPCLGMTFLAIIPASGTRALQWE